MDSFYDSNGNLKARYLINNLISTNGDITSISVSDEMSRHLILRFQNKLFNLYSVAKLLVTNSEVELFPGIYFAKDEKRGCLRRIKKFLTNKSLYVIRNENKKDLFQISSDLKEKLEPAVHEKNKELLERKGNTNQKEYLNPDVVEQPTNLGGGKCGGCPIYSYLIIIGMLETPSTDEYYFFREKEMFEALKHEPYFIDRCKQSDCYATYTKIIKNGYSEELIPSDQIKVTYKNGKYIAGEGKHRICAMRRYGYPGAVPMIVTRIGEQEQVDKTKRISDSKSISTLQEIRERCYSQYEKIGTAQEKCKSRISVRFR